MSHTIKNTSEVPKQQMGDLFAELQRATARQKFRIGES